MQGLKVLPTKLMRSQGSMKLLIDRKETGCLSCTLPAGVTKILLKFRTSI